MSFKYLQDFGFTGMPSNSTFMYIYGIYHAYSASSIFSDTINYLIDTEKLQDTIDSLFVANGDILVWDFESLNMKLDIRTFTDTEVDASLQAIENVYLASKNYAIENDRSDLMIGFYGIPGFSDDYTVISNYLQNPSDALVISEYENWKNAYDRLNIRKSGSTYISKPLSSYVDFFSPKIDMFFGSGVKPLENWKSYAKTKIETVYLSSNNKPIYPNASMYYDPSQYWVGQQLDSTAINIILDTAKNYANGIIIKGGNEVSYQLGDFRYFPTGDSESQDLIAWQGVSNGAFTISLHNIDYAVSGINTHSVINMNQVASILQTAIQSQVLSPNPVPENLTFTTGTLTVSWDSVQKSFLFNLTNGAGSTQPPCSSRQFVSIKSKPKTVGGTDLYDPQFIGIASVNFTASPFNRNYIFKNTRSSTEWTNYASARGWWLSLLSVSAHSIPSVSAVTPVITVKSLDTGEYPITIFVDAVSSNFGDLSIEDCLFEWDFGDPNPSLSNRNYSYISDGRFDNEQDIDGNPRRNTSLNNQQRGMTACYTYYHNNSGTPFTISLTIRYNGIESSTVTKNITVLSPSITNYPTVSLGDWVKVQVMPGELAPVGSAFQKMKDAIAWMNSSKPEGKVIFEILAGQGGDYTLPIQEPLTILSPDVIIRTSSSANVVLHAKNATYNRSSISSFFTIADSSYRVFFQNIQFGADTVISGDTTGNEQNSELSSNLIACTINENAPLDTEPKNINFVNCIFKNLSSAVQTNDNVDCVYFNQCRCYRTKLGSFDLSGTSIVLNNCLIGTKGESGTEDSGSFSLSFGNNETSSRISMNYCNLEYNAYASEDVDSDGFVNLVTGPISIYNSEYVMIYGCRLYSGSNNIQASSNVRFESNIIEAGANAAALVLDDDCSSMVFANNILKTGRAKNAGLFEIRTTSGSIDTIKILNNTAIANSNISNEKGYWDFSHSTDVVFTGIQFVNNLNIENSSYCVSRWISITDKDGEFSAFSNNIWPSRKIDMDFALLNNNPTSWQSWSVHGRETTPMQMQVDITELPDVFGYTLLYSSYLDLFLQAVPHSSVPSDFHDEIKSFFAQHTVGASIPLYFEESSSTESFIISFDLKTRTRTAMSSCYNGYVTVIDGTQTTVNSSNIEVQKPIISQATVDVKNLLDFSISDFNLDMARAFRLKYDTSIDSTYKAAVFGIMLDSSVLKLKGVFTDKYDVENALISLTISSYSFIKDLISAVISLNIPGVVIESLGAPLLSPLLLRNWGSLVDGRDKWAVSYLDNSSVTLGDWINTIVECQSQKDGFDLTITYVNDGPPVQTGGAIEQRMGSICIDGMFLGKLFAQISDVNSTNILNKNNWLGNLGDQSGIYPFGKFSPTQIFFNENHAIGISLLHDFNGSKKEIKTSVFSSAETDNLCNAVFAWHGNNQSDSTDYVIKDCLAYGEEIQVIVSFRVSRTPKDWISTILPYKDYFAQNIGEVRYMKDPRPIWTAVTAVESNGQPFSYQNFYDPANTNPALHGWSWWANNIKNNYKILGYERQLMLSPSGLYGNQNVHNYPFLTLLPLFDSNGSFPHSTTGPHSDTCYSKSGDNCVAGSFSIIPDLLKSTLFLLRDAIQEIPVFGFYQGHASSVHTTWEPTLDEIFSVGDRSNSAIMQYVTNELDLMSYYTKSNIIGFDSYFDGFEDINQSLTNIDIIINLYPHFKIFTNPASNDIMTTRSINLIKSYGDDGPITGSHTVADYITPGAEHVVQIYFPEITDYFEGSISGSMIKNRMLTLANWGFVVNPVYDTISHPASILNEQTLYYSYDRRFVFDTKPDDYPSLATPSNITRALSDTLTNNTYNMRKQSVTLSWTENTETDFSHYIVYKAPIVNGFSDTTKPYQVKAYVKNSSFTDNQVFPGKTYYYKISAFDVYGNQSSIASFSTTYIADEEILDAPLDVSASADFRSGTISVSWKYPE